MKLMFVNDECVSLLQDDTATTGEVYPAPEWVDEGTLALRIVMRDGDIIDRYAGLSDAEALAQHTADQEAENAARAAVFAMTQDEFLIWLGAERRIEIRTLAKTDPAVEDFMDMLNRTATLKSDHPEVLAALQYFESLQSDRLTGVLEDFLSYR